MRLRPDVDLVAFLRMTKKCHGKVIFHSEEGDDLNLRSILCRYIMLARYSGEKKEIRGRVSCQQKEDRFLLREFLIDEETGLGKEEEQL